LPDRRGAWPIFRQFAEGRYLLQDLFPAGEDAGVVHHLGEPQDAVPAGQLQEVFHRKLRSRRLEARRRHARRQHDEDVERETCTPVEDVFDAFDAENVGDFVGVGDDGGRAVGDESLRQLPRRKHRAFDVDVCVDEAGGDEFSAAVENARPGVTAPHADYMAAQNGYVGIKNITSEDVDDPASLQQQVGGDLAAGGKDPQSQFFHPVFEVACVHKPFHFFGKSFLCAK